MLQGANKKHGEFRVNFWPQRFKIISQKLATVLWIPALVGQYGSEFGPSTSGCKRQSVFVRLW